MIVALEPPPEATRSITNADGPRTPDVLLQTYESRCGASDARLTLSSTKNGRTAVAGLQVDGVSVPKATMSRVEGVVRALARVDRVSVSCGPAFVRYIFAGTPSVPAGEGIVSVSLSHGLVVGETPASP